MTDALSRNNSTPMGPLARGTHDGPRRYFRKQSTHGADYSDSLEAVA